MTLGLVVLACGAVLLTVVVILLRVARRGDPQLAQAPTSPLSYFTTACNAFVSKTLNPSGGLQAKTVMVVLSGPRNHEMAAVYRRSGSNPGKLSVDRYALESGGWGPPQKDQAKFSEPPHPPHGAVEQVVEGIQCWTEAPMTDEQTQRVRELINTGRRRL